MKKRKKLSQNQKRRIKEQRTKKLDTLHQADMDDTQLMESEPAVVISRFGQHADVQTEDRVMIRAQIRRNIGSLVTGDFVIIRRSKTDTGGIVEAVQARSSQLTRPDYYDGVKVIAANIDQICIVSSIVPTFSSQIIDRYLIASEDVEIKPILIITKTDLLDAQSKAQLEQELEPYEKLGYPIFYVNKQDQAGIEIIKEQLHHQTSIFVGQSGVGKSSLINAILPEADLVEGEVSTLSGLGQHTTTASKRLDLPDSGHIVDSPGIREFGLWHLHPERVTWCFPEFRPFMSHCKFRDCTHQDDPKCAIRQAVEDHKIHPTRYANYLKIIQSMDEQKDGRHIKNTPFD